MVLSSVTLPNREQPVDIPDDSRPHRIPTLGVLPVVHDLLKDGAREGWRARLA
jgi:hypothetical protein